MSYNNNVIVLTIGTHTIGAVGYQREIGCHEAEKDIRRLYAEWKELNPNPDTDSKFVDWLGDNTQYFQIDPPYVVCLDAD